MTPATTLNDGTIRRSEAFGSSISRIVQEGESPASLSAFLWQEHFVDVIQASSSVDVGAAVSDSYSYVTIPNFGSLEECLVLQNSALWRDEQAAAASSSEVMCGNTDNDDDDDGAHHILGASQVNFNCNRYSVERLLNDPAKTVSATFLARLLALLDDDPELRRVFPTTLVSSSSASASASASLEKTIHQENSTQSTSMLLRLGDLEAEWYAEPDHLGALHPEPKVNIYQKGGYFKRHTDGMQLTLLVVLNDSFEGGGTAFYSSSPPSSIHNEDNGDGDYCSGGSGDPLLVDTGLLSQASSPSESFDRHASPPVGTAMIWGGDLQHMALPVSSGMRSVYVGSFDLSTPAESPDPNDV